MESFPSLSNSYRFFKSLTVLLKTMRTALDPRLTLDDGDTISSFEFTDSFLGAKILRKGAYVSVPITLSRIALLF